MTKALISVTGQDTTGIIASVATKLADLNVNILEISQTILSGCFTMMMVVDLDGAAMDFAVIDESLDPIRKEKKLHIHMQRMDIFDAMHRI
ncbi:MAG: ACT domain-containing protein [Clostridia bacterium]|nr:ACT domain-containing protein [Clostridia bacterium]